MRPVALEMEGFASFRQKAEVRFDDCDLFVLTGRTGSGKSSVIDAITFALYGSVARLDREGSTTPVINQGSLRARVHLTFDAGGHRYSLAREVSRKGATKVAFERDGVSIAASVGDVRREVEATLGLTFQQFTSSVVLPQGDFAEFLHAKPGDRQDLLVKLLDAELFRRVQKQASARASSSKAELDLADHRVDAAKAAIRASAASLGVDSFSEQRAGVEEDAALEAGAARVEVLLALVQRVQAAGEEVARLETEAAALDAEAARHADAATQLEAVATPSSVHDFQQRLTDARESVAAAESGLDTAEQAQAAAEKAFTVLPARAEVAALVTLWEQHATLGNELTVATEALSTAEGNAATAAAKQKSADEARIVAATERERVFQANHAYAAARGLSAGDACPICGETLAAAPSLPQPDGMKAAEAARDAADQALQHAIQSVNRTGKEEAAARERLAGIVGLQLRAEQELQGRDSLDTCREMLGRIAAAELARTRANDALEVARTRLAKARAALTALDGETEAAWKTFGQWHGSCAALGTPPHRVENDLAGSWAALETWAYAESAACRDRAQATSAAAERVAEQAQAQSARQIEDCATLGVDASATSPLLAANTAHTNAGRDLADLRTAVAARRDLESERGGIFAAWQAAESLNGHLRTNRFEQWYLEEALSRLLDGASTTLRELSSGQYSLKLDENRKDFLVVDHTNADETRPVKTLSGGETFLASLALALSLADEIALLAPATAPKLEALFLDEGFGTLDPDTLDTVAAAIEELGARGRMVGIITHVPELAERVPVRFRVTKFGGSSSIERDP